MRDRWVIAGIVLFATVLYASVPLVRGEVEIPTAEHHLLHAAMIAGGVLAGIMFVGKRSRERAGGAGWLIAALVIPVLAMLLMWPSEYAYFEMHRYGHTVEHFGLVLCGLLTGYCGQRYSGGLGWAAGISIVAMALLAAGGYGVSPLAVPSATTAASQTPAPARNPGASANVAHGAVVFAQNCAVCHGRSGAGGEGPSLRNESARKPLAAAEAWIKDPAPPMPKLFPGTLSSQDVADVAAYVETLR